MNKFLYVVSGLVTTLIEFYIFRHWGDSIAQVTGYYFVAFFMPFLIYLLIASPLLFGALKAKSFVYWRWMVAGVVLSYTPTLIFIVVSSIPGMP